MNFWTSAVFVSFFWRTVLKRNYYIFEGWWAASRMCLRRILSYFHEGKWKTQVDRVGLVKNLGTFCTTHNTSTDLAYIKLTRFEDIDSSKLPLNYTCWGAALFAKWVKLCLEIYFNMYNVFTSTGIYGDSPENITLWFFPPKNKTTWGLMKLKLLQVN